MSHVTQTQPHCCMQRESARKYRSYEGELVQWLTVTPTIWEHCSSQELRLSVHHTVSTDCHQINCPVACIYIYFNTLWRDIPFNSLHKCSRKVQLPLVKDNIYLNLWVINICIFCPMERQKQPLNYCRHIISYYFPVTKYYFTEMTVTAWHCNCATNCFSWGPL